MPSANTPRCNPSQSDLAGCTIDGHISQIPRKLHKGLPKAKTTHEETTIERQIAATDRQMNAAVYELFGLTEDNVGFTRRERM